MPFQCCNTFLERFDDTFSICLLLAFHLKNGGRSIIHKLLVTQFLQHTLQESFLMLQFGLHTGYLGFHVNHITQRYGIFRSTYHEGSSTVGLVLHYIDGGKVTHFHDNRVECHNRILTDNLQLKCLFLGDVLLQTDGTDIADNLFHHFKLPDDILIYQCRH